jgi:alanine-glyoxylate transaminase/serine-glyoxylate transaminase/serine-pyruvate transaminase
MPLPSTERILLGPGPSLIAPRVMRAMGAPVLSHLDPDFVPLLDDVRLSLRRLFKADEQALTLATSGTGTSAMEAAVANVVSEGCRAVVVVTGYFGDRLVQIMERYGAHVRRIDVEWGRAVDPALLRAELKKEGADVVGIVHAETSYRRDQPGERAGGHRARARCAHRGRPGDVARRPPGGSGRLGRGRRVFLQPEVHRCALGMSPIAVSGAARSRMVKCRSFYLDLTLLEDYWARPQVPPHAVDVAHLCSAEALQMVEEEGPVRAAGEAPQAPRGPGRGRRGDGPVPGAACRRAAVDVEHGARSTGRGRGGGAAYAALDVQPRSGCRARSARWEDLARRPHGASSTPQSLLQFLAAFEAALAANGYQSPPGAGVAAAQAALRA